MNKVPCEPLTYKQVNPIALLRQHTPEAPRPVPAPPVLAEAPASVNGFFEIEGFGRFQATGRGFTGAEAAANMVATMEATRAALLPPKIERPTSRTAQLGALLTCWLSKAVAIGDLGLAERLSKAAVLVLADAVTLGPEPGTISVQSLTAPDRVPYGVEGTACDCPDSRKHREVLASYLCKHALASMLWQRLTD